MSTQLYAIKHFNNSLDLYSSKKRLISSKWFMEFGKQGAEVFNVDDKIIYYITKKFEFWKWKMVYTIKDVNGNVSELISKNNKKTIFSVDLKGITYELKIHFKKKISIYKNAYKIAEFDESFTDKEFEDLIKLQLLDKKDVEISFLLFSCLKVGEVETTSKSAFASQKQLEPNDDPWS